MGRKRTSWKKQLEKSTKENIKIKRLAKALARPKPKVGDWRTRTDGRLTRLGKKPKFKVGARTTPLASNVDMQVHKVKHPKRPKTVWEREAEERRKRHEDYRKKLEQMKAERRREREIRALVNRCKSVDLGGRRIIKKEFLKKYPNVYAQYDWDKEGKLVEKKEEKRPVEIIIGKREKAREPKREEKPREEVKEEEPEEKKETFTEEEIEKAVEEAEQEAKVEAKHKIERKLEEESLQ